MLFITTFKDFSRAAVQALLSEIDPAAAHPHDATGAVDRAGEFVIAQWGNLQPFFRFGILGLAVYFEWSALIVRGRRFSHCTLASRSQQLAHWLESRVSIRKKFVQFYLSLLILAYFDDRSVLQTRGVDVDRYVSVLRYYYG